jgi:hypothetical protein
MPLFPRFPGNKRNYALYDGGQHDAVIEPFGGSAIFSQQMMQRGAKQIFIADADPTVLAVYKVWKAPHLHHDFYLELRAFQKYLARDPEMAWGCLKENLDYPRRRSTALLAAASLTLRHLTFGGVVRCSENGKLTISYCEERLPVLQRWRYQLPPIPKDCQVNVYSNWLECVTAFSQVMGICPAAKAIALLDPPYYSDRSVGIRMTPAYPGHQPHDISTIDLTIKPLEALLQVPQVRRITITNYCSAALDEQIKAMAATTQLPMRFTQLTKLDGMQRRYPTKTQNVEGLWEFGYPACDQLQLFA